MRRSRKYKTTEIFQALESNSPLKKMNDYQSVNRYIKKLKNKNKPKIYNLNMDKNLIIKKICRDY